MTVRTSKVDLAFPLRAAIGESPVWDDRRSELLVIDIPTGFVHRIAAKGEKRSFRVGSSLGAVGLRDDGGLVLALADGFALADADDAEIARFGEFQVDSTIEHFNDGKPDPWGRFVAGTRHVPRTGPRCALYALSPSGEVSILRDGVQSSNGLAWSSDRQSFFYIDSAKRAIDAFDVHDEGASIHFRKRLSTLQGGSGIFDGMTIDEDDCLWVAHYRGGEVRRYTPMGDLDLIIDIPTDRPTSCAFGGADFRQLFITTASQGMTEADFESNPNAGDIFVYESTVAGCPPNRFSGPAF